MKDKLALPRIQSSRSSNLQVPTSMMLRQQSRQKMIEIQNRANNADFSTQASAAGRRVRQPAPLGERGVNQAGNYQDDSSRKNTPQSNRGKGHYSRPQSIQRNAS